MAISILCPKCTTKSAAPDNAAGRNVKCPKCGVLLAVPSSAGKTPASSAMTTKPPMPVASFADPAKGNPAPRQPAAIPFAHASGKRLLAAHSLGIASLVLGCFALVLSLIPCVGMISLPLSVLGLLLGIGGGAVCIVRKGSGIGMPIAGGVVNGLAIAITISWAILAATITAGAEKQAADNQKDGPPQVLDPLKKEVTKENDPPIAKKEADKIDAAEKRLADLLAQAEELQRKNDDDRKMIAENGAKIELSMKSLLELQKTIAETQKEVGDKRQELVSLKKAIEAEKKKTVDDLLAVKTAIEAEREKADAAKKEKIKTQEKRAADDDTKAEKAIKALGGKVFRDDTGAGMPIIKVDLGDTELTNAGLKELAALEGLKSLDIGGTRVTDAGLKELAGLKNLQSLYLSETGVTNAGLKELAELKSLTTLHIGGTTVNDAGLKEFAGLTSLENLGLSNTQVTNIGLKEVAAFKELRTLNLSGTGVTDAGLKELVGLKRLQRLYLDGTKVTAAGFGELQKALPGIQR